MAAYTTIDDPTIYFNSVLYTGTGSSGSNRQITGVGFQPDWVWIKNRNSAQEHVLVDSIRGATKSLDSSANSAESTTSTQVGAFISDGFQLGSGSLQNRVNGSGNGLVAWNWKAGTSFSNDASATGVGSLDSAGSINTTAGFSIIGYSGDTSDAPSTVAHGLSQKPEMMFIKRRTSTGQWVVYNKTIDATDNLHLDSDAARHDYLYYFQDTEPTSSVFTVGDDGETNKTGDTYINYIFHSVQGYSKIGSYTGNGDADGTYVHLGFKPAFVMIKSSSNSSQSWVIQDNKRDGFNYNNHRLFANSSGNEETTVRMDLLSNGFKCRDNDGNGNGFVYIFMAFAESPFVNSNGVPNNAR